MNKRLLKITIIVLFLVSFINSAYSKLIWNSSNILFFKRTENYDSTTLNKFIQKAFDLAFLDPDSAFHFANTAIKYSSKVSYTKGVSNALHTKGIIFYAIDKNDSALYFFHEAVKYRKLLGDLSGLASTYNYMALSYRNISEYKKAIRYNIKSLGICEEVHDSMGISESLNNLGMNYHLLKDYNNALFYYRKSLEIKKLYTDNKAIASTINNIGLIFYEEVLGDPVYTDSSLQYLLEAFEIRNKLNDFQGMSESLLNIALVYIKLENYKDALLYANNAIKYFKLSGDKFGLASAYFNKGFIYYKKSQYSNALSEYLRSSRIAMEANNLDLVMQNYRHISTLYKDMGNYHMAFENFIIYNEFKDSILSIETKNEVARLQYQYETQKNENIILRQQSDLEKFKLRQSRFIILINVIILIGALTFVIFFKKHLKRTRNLLKIVNDKNNEISNKNEIILDSIKYAETLQKEIIPSQEAFLQVFKNAFVIDKPKDIIGGDFLWFHEKKGQKIIAIVDCIGHGVPGSIMTIAADFLLSKIIKEDEITSPDIILHRLEIDFFQYFDTKEYPRKSLNSMEIGVCSINGNVLEYAGARRPIVIMQKDELIVQKGVSYPIGRIQLDERKKFIKHKYTLNQGDMFYLFSDGIVDQFGGDEFRQLGIKGLLQKVKSIGNLSMNAQKDELETFLKKWCNGFDQIDDIIMIGIQY